MKTTQITVRNVDPQLKLRIDKLAKLKSMSINDFVLDTLRTKVGTIAPENMPSWEHYSGTIGKDGINQSALADFEAIDPRMWKDNL